MIHLWLVKQVELLQLQRFADFMLQGKALGGVFLHFRVEEAPGISPGSLGVVHGLISLLQQFIDMHQAVAKQRNANAGGAEIILPFQGVVRIQALQNGLGNLLGDGGGVIVVGIQILQHYQKLIAPQARDCVLRAHGHAQAVGHGDQQ